MVRSVIVDMNPPTRGDGRDFDLHAWRYLLTYDLVIYVVTQIIPLLSLTGV